MTEFHKQSFSKRFATMGDTAEGVCDRVYPKNHKLGLNRPPFFMGGMPLAMRYTPDRMTRKALIECMGVGRDRKLKLKTEKIEALRQWASIGPVRLFVYDQHKGVYYDAPFEEWEKELRTHGVARTFEADDKSYLELIVEHFPTDPEPVPPDTEPEEV